MIKEISSHGMFEVWTSTPFLKKKKIYFYVIELHWNTWKKRDREYTSIKINK